MVVCNKSYFHFWRVIKKIEETCPKKIVARHSWIRLVESSNTEVSGASEGPQSRGKLIF